LKNKLKPISFFLLLLVFIFIMPSMIYAENLPNTVLTYLERGTDVKEVQQALNIVGYNLATDGIYGPNTKSAVLDFQQKYNQLLNDGVYGPNTKSYLEGALNENQDSNDETPSEGALPNTILTLEDYGSDVKSVQSHLNKIGYNLATDGIYGPRTEGAIVDFQREYSQLTNDGVYGPNTKSYLEGALNENQDSNDETPSEGNLPNTVLTLGDYGSDVRKVQQRLNEIGYDLIVDGNYGPRTKGAILTFQKDYSELLNDGVYGPNTKSYLENATPELIVDNPSDLLVLVNMDRSLPSDYVPNNLREVQVPVVHDSELMRDQAADALEDMFNAAESDGYTLYAESGYRSYEVQKQIFRDNVDAYGRDDANDFSAPPGHSEHQTGLTIDVTSSSVDFQLTTDFAYTEEGQWVANNAWRYGFIVRYPEGKFDITGYQYEPWHLRYIGKDASEYIHANNITLEEYIK